MSSTEIIRITSTSPATASTAAGTSTVDISGFDHFEVYLDVQGGTGGTLDVYIQGRHADTWVDFYHHPQMAAGAGSEYRKVVPESHAIVTTVGTGTSPALASGVVAGSKPGDALRFCFVAGASTSAGAAQVMTVVGFKS